MNKFYTLILGMLSLATANVQSQEYTLSVEEYAVNGVEGQTTYRLYVDMVYPDDFLSSVYGGEGVPLEITTTTNFYNDIYGGVVGSDINPAFIAFFPELQYDSWVTIGLESQNMGSEMAISIVEDPNQPFTSNFAYGSPTDGQNVLINTEVGGVWYVLNGASNGLPDSNSQVLIAQITTDGELCGLLNVQIFEHGNGGVDIYHTFEFCGIGTFSSGGGIVGCMDPEACNFNGFATQDDGSCEFSSCLGCIDATACNYNPESTIDDGSCEYPEEGFDCEGNCLNDTDGDGICDEFEVLGCTDATACNYDVAATEDDGSCWFVGDYYDCEGNCYNDVDGDGVCDELEEPGCLDEEACNYNESATDEDGSCVYAEDGYDCDGNCLNDADGDGVCDEFEIAGCTDPLAENYNAEATDDDGSCYYCDIIITIDSFTNNIEDTGGEINITISGGTPPYNITWTQVDGEFESNEEDINDLEGGIYQVLVTDVNECSSTDEVEIENTVGINEINNKHLIYPNPSNEWIKIEFSEDIKSIQIIDVNGKVVFDEQITSTQNYTLSLDGWVKGIYLVNVITNTSSIQEKLLIK